MLSLLIAVAFVQTALPPVVAGPGAQNVTSLLSSTDYPEEAVRNNWQGDVVLDLNITTAGRVRACRIVQSSGYAVLDLKTCEIMLVRARFAPARNSLNQAVEDVFRTPVIRWRLEQAGSDDERI